MCREPHSAVPLRLMTLLGAGQENFGESLALSAIESSLLVVQQDRVCSDTGQSVWPIISLQCVTQTWTLCTLTFLDGFVVRGSALVWLFPGPSEILIRFTFLWRLRYCVFLVQILLQSECSTFGQYQFDILESNFLLTFLCWGSLL